MSRRPGVVILLIALALYAPPITGAVLVYPSVPWMILCFLIYWSLIFLAAAVFLLCSRIAERRRWRGVEGGHG
jgi:hypothetical protein